MNEQVQSKFEGWAVLEVYGHTRAAGFVTTEYYGNACLFRVDTPDLPEREFELKSPEMVHKTPELRVWAQAGSKVKREAMPAFTRFYGTGALFSLTPCSEETARRAIEEIYPRPIIAVNVIERRQLADRYDEDITDAPDDELEKDEIPY